MFFEYGDDSVAQLGGVHLACEQASNLLTKVLEWGRLMSYLEQSTRYIAYDARLGGRYRYYRDPLLLGSPLGTRYVGDMDRLFDTYGELVEAVTEHVRATTPQAGPPTPTSSTARRPGPRRSTRCAGVLPAASISNVGIYGTGQAFEALLLRMRSHPLPEARHYAELMLHELRKVIPSFLRRVDLPDRGGAWSELPGRHPRCHGGGHAAPVRRHGARSRCPRWCSPTGTPTPRTSCWPRSATRTPDLPEHQVLAAVRKLGADDRVALVRAYVGERANRRHKPGRAFERVDYRFDVLADYGAFRDLQRHRMLTIEWQPLSPRHGYVRPASVEAAGQAAAFDERHGALGRAVRRHRRALPRAAGRLRRRHGLPRALRHAVQRPRGRSTCSSCARRRPGHPAYRQVCLEMHRLIAEQAGHRAVAEAMSHVDHTEPELARLEGERRAEVRRLGR